MIKVSIRDIRKVERADLEIDGICLVTGPNNGGKSSICQAVASALAGVPVVWPGVAKGQAKAIVRDGAKSGSVSIAGEGWTIGIGYPKADLVTEGEPPAISLYAAGLASIATMAPKDRAEAFASYVDAAPTRADLEAALKDARLDDDLIGRVWAKIERDGWDAAAAAARERSPELKGRWREVTGEQWGAAKAAGWAPEGWTEDLETADPEALDLAVAEAERSVSEAVAATAVDADRRAALEQRAAPYDEVNAQLEAETAALEALEAAAQKAVEAADAAQSALKEAEGITLTCPHCETPFRLDVTEKVGDRGVVYQRTYAAVKPPENAAPKNFAALKKAKTKAATEAEKASKAFRDKQSAVADLAQTLAEIARAREELAALGEPSAVGTVSVEDAKADRAAAKAKAAMVSARARAGKIHAMIVTNGAIVDALGGPDGVRATVLARHLEAFNGRWLLPLTDKTWPAIEVRPDFSITWGGRPYPLLSASEQWRVRAVLAVAMAQIDGSPLVVLDGADILDTAGRNALFAMLIGSKRHALVGLTETKRDRLPGLEPRGLGRVYWMENGQANRVTADREAA